MSAVHPVGGRPHLPSPPSPPGKLGEFGVGAEHEQQQQEALDDLLSAYLTALDRYSTLREQVSKGFANGFISLAEANFKRSSSAGGRYGQDDYDGRAKATTTVDLRKDHGRFKFAIARREAAEDGAKPVDPILQFGLLVPPALRSAQSSFAGAVGGPLAGLLETVGELEALELLILKARSHSSRAS